MSLPVPDWIITLEQELKHLTDEEKREEQLARLADVYEAYQGEDRVISSHDLAIEMQGRPAVPKIPSGLKGLDDIIEGFVKKQLIVIAAPTKNGKTSFCIELTSQMKDEHPLWFPFEEPAEELIQKFLDRGEPPPLFFTPQKMLRPDTKSWLEWIENRIIESKVKYGSTVAFIDHLHFVVPFSTDRQDLVIGAAMRELKRIAKTWNVVIFLIAHLKKTKLDTNPDLEDLRDSSFIAQEADTVILLWRKTERVNREVVITNEVNVSVQANRRTGKTGNVKLLFDKGRFLEVDNLHDQELDIKNW